MATPRKRAPRDVALLCGPTEDGKGTRILRAREGQLESGEVRPVKEGQPINRGELVKLTPREEAPCVCDVEVLHGEASHAEPSSGSEPAALPAAEPRGRPAQVATDDYRSNWDRIFGRPAARRGKRDTSLN